MTDFTHKVTKLFVKTILSNPEHFKWSIQGLGMLRVYLSDEVRLHVWDSRYKVPNVSDLHDHPWDFSSYIVAGAVRQYRYQLLPPVTMRFDINDMSEPYSMFKIKCGEGTCTLTPKEIVHLKRGPIEFYTESQFYEQKKNEIHQSLPLDGTVTLVKRTFHPNREQALVFAKGDGNFVSAEPRPATPEEVRDITQVSLNRWFTEFSKAPECA